MSRKEAMKIIGKHAPYPQYEDLKMNHETEIKELSSVIEQLLERSRQLEAERDAMAAHVERIHSAVWSQARKQYPSTASINIAVVLSEVHRDAKSSLARLKAKWQAEVLESCENMAETLFIPCLGREEQVVLMDDILKVAAELRRPAEGGVK